MPNIYVIRKGKHLLGPYSFEEIKSTGLRQTDVVWYKASPDDQYEASDFESLMMQKKNKLTIQNLFGRRFIRRRIIVRRGIDKTLHFLQARITGIF